MAKSPLPSNTSPPAPAALSQPKDLLDLLLMKWQEAGSDSEGPSPECKEYLAAFIDYSRRILQDNQPIATDNLHGVLAIRFQDMTSVPVLELPQGVMMPPTVSLNKGGPGGVVPGRSWGVTGEKK